jgi:hypothetical protein
MGEVIKLNPGNGAREAMIATLENIPDGCWKPYEHVDLILAHLWVEGFKVVPLEPGDE